MMVTHSFTLCLGSNTRGLRHHNILTACCALAKVATKPLRCSQILESESYTGMGDAYLNRVVEGSTLLTFDEFTAMTKSLETKGGRTPQSKAQGVIPLDIDIVKWDETIIDKAETLRPHFMRCTESLDTVAED